jgi:hypothetical protein
MKKPGGWFDPTAGLDAINVGCLLDHAEHDGADEGERDIGGNNAQSADDSHGNSPWFTPLPDNHENSKAFPERKSALLTIALFPQAEPWLKLRKINALKSP